MQTFLDYWDCRVRDLILALSSLLAMVRMKLNKVLSTLRCKHLLATVAVIFVPMVLRDELEIVNKFVNAPMREGT